MTKSTEIHHEILNAVLRGRRPSKWVTRERPKIDRIACPWAVLRFIDPSAEVIFVPPARVFDTAERERAIAFDIPGALISHEGELCSFDTLIECFKLDDEALLALAPIVRGADTDQHGLAPEAAGLHAVSQGLAYNFTDDQKLLEHGLVVYDALYSWAKHAKGERHAWTPAVR